MSSSYWKRQMLLFGERAGVFCSRISYPLVKVCFPIVLHSALHQICALTCSFRANFNRHMLHASCLFLVDMLMVKTWLLSGPRIGRGPWASKHQQRNRYIFKSLCLSCELWSLFHACMTQAEPLQWLPEKDIFAPNRRREMPAQHKPVII